MGNDRMIQCTKQAEPTASWHMLQLDQVTQSVKVTDPGNIVLTFPLKHRSTQFAKRFKS